MAKNKKQISKLSRIDVCIDADKSVNHSYELEEFNGMFYIRTYYFDEEIDELCIPTEYFNFLINSIK